MRLTIACPDALRDDANQLAMVLGYGPSDAETYVALNWQDAGGTLYASAGVIHLTSAAAEGSAEKHQPAGS